jgi:ubiquinone/menaquinone biosynthesis C-methylase UbiE
VVANHVLTDVPDPAKAISDFVRVLRHGGRFVTLTLHPCFYGPEAERRVDAPQTNVIEYSARPRIVRQPSSSPA